MLSTKSFLLCYLLNLFSYVIYQIFSLMLATKSFLFMLSAKSFLLCYLLNLFSYVSYQIFSFYVIY